MVARRQYNPILSGVTIAAVLYVGHAAFVPIALALLCALVLSGPVEALQRYRISRTVSAVLILLLVIGLIIALVDLIWTPAQHWLEQAPMDIEIVKSKLSPLTQFISHVEDVGRSARAVERGADVGNLPIGAPNSPLLLLDATRAIAVTTLAFIVVTLSLLVGGPPMLARMTAALVRGVKSSRVAALIEAVRVEVGRYYVTTALINAGFGCMTSGAMALCNMPNPVLWGTLAAVLNFIPYAGSAATLFILSAVALVSFDSLAHVAAVAGSYVVLSTLVGQVIQPLLIGRRLQVNPLLIFLALWFGGMFWGIAGIVLSTPILVALKVVAEHVEGGEAFVKFLSPHLDGLLSNIPLPRVVGASLGTSRSEERRDAGAPEKISQE